MCLLTGARPGVWCLLYGTYTSIPRARLSLPLSTNNNVVTRSLPTSPHTHFYTFPDTQFHLLYFLDPIRNFRKSLIIYKTLTFFT